MKILLIDNYDSFTFNLLHYLQTAGAEVEVCRNDELSEDQMKLNGFDAGVLSPGPGRPEDSANLMEFVRLNIGKKPILGVCLGMQAIGLHFGWQIIKAAKPVHGKPSDILHSQKGVFKNIPNPMQAGRYHSLIIKNSTDKNLQIDAECEGEIMAVSNQILKVWGVQFHPESILTPYGQQIINNWVALIS